VMRFPSSRRRRCDWAKGVTEILHSCHSLVSLGRQFRQPVGAGFPDLSTSHTEDHE
jgi:hypothetical protein